MHSLLQLCKIPGFESFVMEAWYHKIQFTPALKSKEILRESPQSRSRLPAESMKRISLLQLWCPKLLNSYYVGVAKYWSPKHGRFVWLATIILKIEQYQYVWTHVCIS